MPIRKNYIAINPYKMDPESQKNNSKSNIYFIVTKAGSVRVVRTKQSSPNRVSYEKIRKEALRLRKV